MKRMLTGTTSAILAESLIELMKMKKLTDLGDQRRALDSDPLEDAFAVAICLMSIGFEIPKAIKTSLVLNKHFRQDELKMR